MITIPLRPGFGGQVAPGRPDDFHDANAFVAEAIKDAFHHPDLTAEQIADNARIASIAERTCREAIGQKDRAVFVAKDSDTLAGFVIVELRQGSGRQVDRKDAAMPEIDWLIVAPEWQGRGVAGLLMEQALAWIHLRQGSGGQVGEGVPVQLGVIHFNARAIAFYKKWGFEDTGRIVGRHKIPRRLMVRGDPGCKAESHFR